MNVATSAFCSHVQRDPKSTDNTPTPTVRVAMATDGESIGLKFWVNETHVLGKSKQSDGDGESLPAA